MTKNRLLVPLIIMIVTAALAVGLSVGTNSKPILGLDLQGGFSVVLQAKKVDGRLPSEESVEKAKDIIRQRVDGLGVAEPDITRQGRTVIVQLPGVKNRKKAEGIVGNTAKLEFRPVLAQIVNPDAPTIPPKGGKTGKTGKTTTTSTPATTSTTVTGKGEAGIGMVGASSGEGALPLQFAPTTTTTTTPPTTTTTPPSTTTPASTTTTPGITTTTVPGKPAVATNCGGSSASLPAPPEPLPPGAVQCISEDAQSIYILGPVGFEGEALSKATATLSEGEWQVSVNVKASQQEKANLAFNACASGVETCPAQNGKGPGAIAIVLDGKVLSAPAVNSQNLASDTFTITGSFSQSEAKELALVLRYGSLPVEFEQVALQQVSATLGADSLRAGLIAGLIGVAALAIYMVLYYRGFGLVVVASLLVWASLMYGMVCLLSAQQGLALTLAGITGVIVSVGTTVDTYVVVFERIKDELREGRTLRASTERGYRSGINTVFTANGAAFLGAFLLWYLTVGPVRGFAYFLGLSVILDLVVAVAFTRPLILLLSRSPRFAKARFLGIGASADQVNRADVASPTKVVAP